MRAARLLGNVEADTESAGAFDLFFKFKIRLIKGVWGRDGCLRPKVAQRGGQQLVHMVRGEGRWEQQGEVSTAGIWATQRAFQVCVYIYVYKNSLPHSEISYTKMCLILLTRTCPNEKKQFFRPP